MSPSTTRSARTPREALHQHHVARAGTRFCRKEAGRVRRSSRATCAGTPARSNGSSSQRASPPRAITQVGREIEPGRRRASRCSSQESRRRARASRRAPAPAGRPAERRRQLARYVGRAARARRASGCRCRLSTRLPSASSIAVRRPGSPSSGDARARSHLGPGASRRPSSASVGRQRGRERVGAGRAEQRAVAASSAPPCGRSMLHARAAAAPRLSCREDAGDGFRSALRDPPEDRTRLPRRRHSSAACRSAALVVGVDDRDRIGRASPQERALLLLDRVEIAQALAVLERDARQARATSGSAMAVSRSTSPGALVPSSTTARSCSAVDA